MKPKLDVASDLLKTIVSLELSPIEVKTLTLMWLSYYPFLLNDCGRQIQLHADLRSIMAKIEKLKAVLEKEHEVTSVIDLLSDIETTVFSDKSSETGADEKISGSVLSLPVLPQKPKKQKPRKKTAKSPPVVITVAPKIPAETASSAMTSAKVLLPVFALEMVREELISKLKYSKQYKYDLLYSVNNLYIRSPFKLHKKAGVKPIGVVVPYMHHGSPYEMVVYYADEKTYMPLSMAQEYAKSKLLPYKGCVWRVKERTDDAYLYPVLSAINALFRKMGGNPLKGYYVDGRGLFGDNRAEADFKIRYVCNIPLFKP